MTDKTPPSSGFQSPAMSAEPVSTAGLHVEEQFDIEQIELTSEVAGLTPGPEWQQLEESLAALDAAPEGFSFDLAAELTALRTTSMARQEALEERCGELASRLEERELELQRQSAKISSLTLERDGLRSRIEDAGMPQPAWMEQQPQAQDQQRVNQLKERLEERARALVVAREEIARLCQERDRLAAALLDRGEQVARLLDQLKSREARRRFDGDFRRALTNFLRGRRSDPVPEATRESETADPAVPDVAAVETVVLDAETHRPEPEVAPTPPKPAPVVTLASSPGALPRRYLIALEPGSNESHELSGKRVYVGRGVEAGVRLLDATVSRVHAVLRLEGEQVMVADSNSTNGVFVNGRRVRSALLTDFDTVAFGEVSFLFRLGPAIEQGSRRQQ